MLSLEFIGAEVFTPAGLETRPLAISDGLVTDKADRRVDLSGYRILPGIIDVHGDAFERHVAPRRGAMKDTKAGILAAEAEMAANGITTGVLAQFISWEGGVRGLDFADQVFCAIRDASTRTALLPQARLETHLLDIYAEFPQRIADWQVPYVVFNDHLPHDRLAAGRTPKRLTGQALKAGRSPEAHLAMLQDLHSRSAEVPGALDTLCKLLTDQGVRLGSHDDRTAEQRQIWTQRGIHVAEFPETLEAAEAEGLVVLGAPNLVRGGSHKGNVSALDVVMMGACDALASDYHYPSLRRAALFLAKTLGLPEAWKLVSEGPAKVLGLTDRGRLEKGYRADLLILDQSDQIAATLSGGQISYLAGDIAERLVAAH